MLRMSKKYLNINSVRQLFVFRKFFTIVQRNRLSIINWDRQESFTRIPTQFWGSFILKWKCNEILCCTIYESTNMPFLITTVDGIAFPVANSYFFIDD